MPVLLNNTTKQILTGDDSIVIQKCLEDVPGGKSLDTTGFTPTEIKAGHILAITVATGVIKPIAISGNAYTSLPDGTTVKYYGVALQTVPTVKALVGVMRRGTVNEAASPYAVPAGAKTALNPLIQWVND